MALSMVLLAFAGASAQISSTPGLLRKARIALTLAYLIGKEMIGIFSLVPSVARSYLLYSSLPSHRLLPLPRGNALASTIHASTIDSNGGRGGGRHRYRASVARNIRYGDAERNLLDVYIPVASYQEARPVMMFVHGGIWASGNKEMFSHLGVCLADYGIVSVVIQYSLFPEVLASEQVTEVSKALSWVMDNAADYGGNPDRVSLVGHSAGGHLAAMALWERLCCQQLEPSADAATSNGGDARQPSNFIGLSGLYDIVEHYKHECKRGVASLSCMKPAMGGPQGFESMSPALLFKALPPQKGKLQQLQHCDGVVINNPATDKVGRFLAKCTFFSSHRDSVVPPYSSCALHEVLLQLGFDSRLVVFDNLQHADFVRWGLEGREEGELRSLLEEIVQIVAQDSNVRLKQGN